MDNLVTPVSWSWPRPATRRTARSSSARRPSRRGVISVAQTALPDDLQWVIEPSVGPADHERGPRRPGRRRPPRPSADRWRVRPTPGDRLHAGDFAASRRVRSRSSSAESCNASDQGALRPECRARSPSSSSTTSPGDPPSSQLRQAAPVTIPTLTISQSAATTLVIALGTGPVRSRSIPARAISLTNTMVGTSSRGLDVGSHRAKPDIGAPGAWLSAEAGHRHRGDQLRRHVRRRAGRHGCRGPPDRQVSETRPVGHQGAPAQRRGQRQPHAVG